MTLTGIVFALVLIVIQFGLFLGFTTTTSNNIDHSNADLWVFFHGVAYFDTGRNFPERKFNQVLSTPGVAQAEKYLQAFGRWGGKHSSNRISSGAVCFAKEIFQEKRMFGRTSRLKYTGSGTTDRIWALHFRPYLI